MSILSKNDYRWFFIPTIQYYVYNVSVLNEVTRESEGNFRDRGLKGHFLCWTITFYDKRTPVGTTTI